MKMTLQQRIDRLTPSARARLESRLRSVSTPRDAPAGARTERLVAYVVGRDGRTPSATDLREFVSARLPAFMVPAAFIPLEALPVLPNGKVDRRALAGRRDAPVRPSGGEAATTPLEVQLTRIWDDLLDVRDIRRDDNFFELGGHSLLLPRLIERIRADFGVDLPLGIIFQAPTITGLAGILRSRDPNLSWRSLVPIRPEGKRPPLYMVHGLGGEIGYFYNLADHLHPDQPLFGLQAPAEPFEDLPAMATRYLDEVRAHQPRGPYLLGGYCVGGCVAYEMARQLETAGERVGLVAIVDAVTPGSLSLKRRLKRLAARKPRAIVDTLRNKAKQVTGRLARGAAEPPPVDISDVTDMETIPRAFHEAAARHFRALRDYVPQPYRGDVSVFRSEDPRYEADLGWGDLVRGSLTVGTIPGHHADVLKEPNLRHTARAIAAAVEQAAAREG